MFVAQVYSCVSVLHIEGVLEATQASKKGVKVTNNSVG